MSVPSSMLGDHNPIRTIRAVAEMRLAEATKERDAAVRQVRKLNAEIADLDTQLVLLPEEERGPGGKS